SIFLGTSNLRDLLARSAVNDQSQDIRARVMTSTVGHCLGRKNGFHRPFSNQNRLTLSRASDYLAARINDKTVTCVFKCRKLSVALGRVRVQTHTCRGDDVARSLGGECPG